MTLFHEPRSDRSAAIAAAVPGNPRAAADLAELAALVRADPNELLVVLGAGVALADAVGFAAAHRLTRPSLGVVLLREQVDVAVLAEAIRSGIREVITADHADELRAACARSLSVSRHLSGGPTGTAATEGRLVTVFAGKGGCGKSTMATNLAVALSDGNSRAAGPEGRGGSSRAAGPEGRGGSRNRVCLVDLDLSFGDIAIMLQLVPKRSLSDAVPMAGRLDETGIRSLVTPYSNGIDTLLAPAHPAEGDRVGRELVSEILKITRRMYDYVVVDTPPFFSDQVLAALDLSQWYILLATPDIPALKNLRLTLDMFDMLEYPTSQRIVVLNRCDAQVGLTPADIERVVRAPIAGRVPSTRDVPVSINRGVPLMVDSPNNPVSRYIREIVETRMAASGPVETPAAPARRGFALRRKR